MPAWRGLRTLLCTAILLNAGGTAFAQPVSGYTFVESTESYTALGGTASTASGDDASEGTLPIGFNFNFGGTVYTTFSINTNGWIRLGTTIPVTGFSNSLANFTNATNYMPIIAPYWDDHYAPAGSITYSSVGGVLTVDWNNINISGGGSSSATNFGSFKLRLIQADNSIEFVYGSVMTPVGTVSASTGISHSTGYRAVTPGPGISSTSTNSTTAANFIYASTANLLGKKFRFFSNTSCTAPIATADQSVSCATNTYTISGSVTNMGSATSVSVVSSLLGTIATLTSPGSFGPSASTAIGTSQTITFVHNLDALCNAPGGSFNGTGVLCNDNCSGAVPITCATGSIAGSNVGATGDGTYPSLFANSASSNFLGNAVWYQIAGTNQSVTLTTCGSSTDTRIHVYSSCTPAAPITGSDDFCGLQSSVTFPALPGNTYYIAVDLYGATTFGAFTLNVSCVALCSPFVTNETCATAQPVTVNGAGSCTSTASGDNTCAAAGTNPACIGGFTARPDTWYSFTPSGSSVEMIITTGSTGLGFTLYSDPANNCTLTEFTCVTTVTSGNINLITGLTPGTPYKLKIFSLPANVGSYTLCVRDFALPPQDNCPGVDLASLTSPLTASTLGGNADFTLPCVATSNTAPDHVYYIDVPDQSTLRIQDISDTYDACHQILIGPSCPGSTSVLCTDNDNQQENYANTSGSTQRVWWIQDGVGTGSGSYTLEWSILPCIVPAATAFTVLDCPNGMYSIPVNITSLGNSGTVSITSSYGGGSLDITGISAPGTYPVGPIPTGNASTITVVHTNPQCNLPLGTYNVPTTTICNDDCSGAITLACNTTISGTTVGAGTDTYPSDCGAGGAPTAQIGVWYKYVGDDQEVTLTTCNPTGFDTRITVYSGTCGALSCVGGNDDMGASCSYSTLRSLVNFNAFVGTDYYIMVHGFSTFTGGNFELTTSCGPLCLPAPANDICSLAELATVNASGCAITYAGNNRCANESLGASTSCFSTFGNYNDVFYRFQAPSPNVFMSLTYGSATSLGYQLFNDGCTINVAPLACNGGVVSGDPALLSLTTGNFYILRVMSPAASAGTFTLCLQDLAVTDVACSAIPVVCGDVRFGRTTGYLNNLPPLPNRCPYNGTASTGGVNWWTYHATSDQDVTVSTCGLSIFDTRISVYTPAPTCSDLQCLAMNDNAPGCVGGSSEVTFPALTGRDYYIVVHGAGAAEGNYQMAVTCAGLCSPGVANDHCNTATSVTAVLNDGLTLPSTEQQGCAYVDGPTACSSADPVEGVWYTFNSGSHTHFSLYLLDHDLAPAYTATQVDFALYSGDCSADSVGADNEITCVTDASGYNTLPTLTTNTDYRYMVYNQGGVGVDGTFGMLLIRNGTNDAGITAVTEPSGVLCDVKSQPVVVLTNFGEAPLASALITVHIDALPTALAYNWSTATPIPYLGSLSITLPEISLVAGQHVLHAVVSNPNGAADENATNDHASSNYDASGQAVVLKLTMDNNASGFTWDIIENTLGTIVAEGGTTVPPVDPNTIWHPGPYANNASFTVELCLPTNYSNCYSLRLHDTFGDGLCCSNGLGSWTLLSGDGRIVVQDDGQFTFHSPSNTPQTPSYNNGHEFCLPLGPADILASECEIFINTPSDKVYCNTVPGASKYQFRFANPDLGYYRYIAVTTNYVAFNQMVSNPLTPGVIYFADVRADQGSLNDFTDDVFGGGCQMAIDPNLTYCTQLNPNPGPTYSCGATRAFGGNSKIWALPIATATQYQFRFVNVGEGYQKTVTRNNYVCPLNWVTTPLLNGSTYTVTVEVKVGGTFRGYCGTPCSLTILNTPAAGPNLNVDVVSSNGVQLWPNPVRDGNVNLLVEGMTDETQDITVDVYDTQGRLLLSKEYGNSGDVFNTVLELGSDVAAGTYQVNVTVNGRTTTQRLSVQ